MCLHEVQERLDRIALGTSSSSMLLLRVGGGEDSGGMVTCHAPPPMEEDEDVAGWSIIVASPAGGLWHAQPPLSPESTASALLIKAHPSPPYCMHPPVLTPHYGAPTFHSAPPVLPAPVPCALPPMHAQAQQHTGRYILSALLQAQRVLLRPRV